MIFRVVENFIVQINKTTLSDRFYETEADRELIFQQLVSTNIDYLYKPGL